MGKGFITILDWHRELPIDDFRELGLFSLIYGFTQDGVTKYYGSLSYTAKQIMVSRPTIIRLFDKLIEKNLIIKESGIQGIETNRYMVNMQYINEYLNNEKELQVVKKLYRGSKGPLQGVVKKLYRGSKGPLHDNNIYNNKNNNIYNKEKKILKKSENSTKQIKRGKKKLIDYFPQEWEQNTQFTELIEEFTIHRKQKRTPLTQIAMKRLASKLLKWTIEDACAAIEQSLENGYTGVFLPNKQKKKPANTYYSGEEEYSEGIEIDNQNI